jgi:hypothetical protein
VRKKEAERRKEREEDKKEGRDKAERSLTVAGSFFGVDVDDHGRVRGFAVGHHHGVAHAEGHRGCGFELGKTRGTEYEREREMGRREREKREKREKQRERERSKERESETHTHTHTDRK